MKVGSFVGHCVGSVIGVIFSIGLWLILNILAATTEINFIQDVANFVNSNLYLFVITTVLGFIAKSFEFILFPVSLIAPFLHALNSIFILTIFFRMLVFVNDYLEFGFVDSLISSPLRPLIYTVVFFLTLVFGTLSITLRTFSDKDKIKEDWKADETIEKIRLGVADAADNFSRWLRK